LRAQIEPRVDVPPTLIDAVRSFPLQREVEHCGSKFAVSPFQFYALCPHCGLQIKVRSFSANPEIEDVFDAVFEWMLQPGAGELAKQRQQDIDADRNE
jgi:hypothetical protein